MPKKSKIQAPKKPKNRQKPEMGPRWQKSGIFELPKSFFKSEFWWVPGPWDLFKNRLILTVYNLNFPPFFQEIFFAKITLKPIFFNETKKLGKKLIYGFNILQEKWALNPASPFRNVIRIVKIVHSACSSWGSVKFVKM